MTKRIDGVYLRHLDPDTDVPALVRLRAEIEAVDRQGADTSEDGLRAQFNWSGHDPSQDRLVLENLADGELVGHAWTFAQSPIRSILKVAVHPDWRRQGLGTQLLSKTIGRARELGAIQVVSGASASNQAGLRFLEANRFGPAGHSRFMTAPGHIRPESPIWPEGFSLSRYADSGDLSLLVEGSNRCYSDMWGHRENTEPATVELFRENMARYPNHYQPEGILLILDGDGQVAGICFSRLEGVEKKKVIDSPGVVPRYRHLGLQRPLVQASMLWLSSQTEGDYHLHTWGDFEEAVQIYRQLGFSLAPRGHFIEHLLQ